MKPRRLEFAFVLLMFLFVAFMFASCSAEINAQPQSAVKPKLAAASPPLRVTTDHNDGSGNPVDWSDDEDINSEGSGSGDGEPPVQPMPAVAQRELITQPTVQPSTPPKPTVTERSAIPMQRPTNQPTAASPPPISKSAHRHSPLSLIMLFLIILFVHISR
uniref:Uncharacterized protein n=1 Tax=Parascaris univalens TaxID=6257 RepID=A0A915AHE3_PARUN